MITFRDIQKFWNTRPCNIMHSNKLIGTKEYFDEVETKKYFVEPHIKEFAEFPRWNDKKVLEIGCGIGTDSINFVRHGAKLTVVELSDASLEICRQRFCVYNLQANFIQGNVEHLTTFLPKQHFDLIYSFGVLHHTLNPAKGINELKKYMHCDSELRIMLYAKYSWKLFDIMHNIQQWDFSQIDSIIQKYSEAQTGCPCTHTYTINDVYKLLQDFYIINIQQTHIFPYKIPEYFRNEYIMVDSLKDMPQQQFNEMSSVLGWHLLITARIK